MSGKGSFVPCDVHRERMYASDGELSGLRVCVAETVVKLSVLSAALPLSVTSDYAQAAIQVIW